MPLLVTPSTQSLRGAVGTSGYSGYSGWSGRAGTPGVGTSGYSGWSGMGTSGSPGLAGSVWRNGSGAPSNSLGANGDYYLDVSSGDVFARSGGTYSIVGNLKGAYADPISPSDIADTADLVLSNHTIVAQNFQGSGGGLVDVPASKIYQGSDGPLPSMSGENLYSLNASNISAGTVDATYLPSMVGDTGTGGTAGMVPAPAAGDAAKFLRGDATWASISPNVQGLSGVLFGTNSLSSGSATLSLGVPGYAIAVTAGPSGTGALSTHDNNDGTYTVTSTDSSDSNSFSYFAFYAGA